MKDTDTRRGGRERVRGEREREGEREAGGEREHRRGKKKEEEQEEEGEGGRERGEQNRFKNQDSWTLVLIVPSAQCVISGNTLLFPGPQFSHF